MFYLCILFFSQSLNNYTNKLHITTFCINTNLLTVAFLLISNTNKSYFKPILSIKMLIIKQSLIVWPSNSYKLLCNVQNKTIYCLHVGSAPHNNLCSGASKQTRPESRLDEDVRVSRVFCFSFLSVLLNVFLLLNTGVTSHKSSNTKQEQLNEGETAGQDRAELEQQQEQHLLTQQCTEK